MSDFLNSVYLRLEKAKIMLGFRDFIKNKLSGSSGPKKFAPNDRGHLNVSRADILDQSKIRKHLHDMTNKNVSDEDVPAVSKYLADSKPVDDHYRGLKSTPEAKEHAARLENIVKKTKTPQKMIMYRGFQSEDKIGPGKELTHHGITSYGGSDAFAQLYHDNTRTNHLIRLKVPEGAHAAYIEHIDQERRLKANPKQMERHFNHGGEENWILHPGAKVKVTHSHWDEESQQHIHDAELIHDGVEDHEQTTKSNT